MFVPPFLSFFDLGKLAISSALVHVRSPLIMTCVFFDGMGMMHDLGGTLAFENGPSKSYSYSFSSSLTMISSRISRMRDTIISRLVDTSNKWRDRILFLYKIRLVTNEE